MSRFRTIVSALGLLVLSPAGAVTIDIAYPEPDVIRASLFDIDPIPDRVYTVRTKEDGTASIVFGDGIGGARPSSEGGVVASYRFGTGLDGKIVNEYPVTDNELPFIPITDFWPSGEPQSDASFILAGLLSIKFDFSLEGLRVLDAERLPAPIPLPPALLLFGTCCILLVAFTNWRSIEKGHILPPSQFTGQQF